ncbi:hypothetical protein IFO70_10310 [Phormidium tenue FACHB-886]|nr:hypothetical protein [Phormidium tenue FACHB-886]
MSPHDRHTLTALLQSKSKAAHLFGFGIALFIFLPSVFRVAGDENLTIWQRLEQLSVAAGQTLFTVALAAVPPEAIAGKSDSTDDSEA